eukprot:s772_g2.t1
MGASFNALHYTLLSSACSALLKQSEISISHKHWWLQADGCKVGRSCIITRHSKNSKMLFMMFLSFEMNPGKPTSCHQPANVTRRKAPPFVARKTDPHPGDPRSHAEGAVAFAPRGRQALLVLNNRNWVSNDVFC